jgi:PhnB protein
MSDRSNAYKPDGWRAVTPRLVTTDVAGLVHFLKVVFDAEGELQADRPSELRIDDAMVMVSDGGGVREPMPSFLYVYVPDADMTYLRAIAAGAEALEAPADMPDGDRRATVRDQWGNIWQIATRGARGID